MLAVAVAPIGRRSSALAQGPVALVQPTRTRVGHSDMLDDSLQPPAGARGTGRMPGSSRADAMILL